MTGMVRGARPAATALAGAGLLLAACGSPSRPAAGPATVHATGAPASPRGTGAAACPASGLAAGVGASGAALGTRYVPVGFANKSGHACLMDGYPAVWFSTGEDGPRVGPAAIPDVSQGGPQRVTVSAGGSAHFWLEVPTAQDWAANSCRPVTAHWLRVVPPRQTAPLHVHLPYGVAVCSATASGFNLAVMPVRPGRGVVGHTP